MTRSEFLVVGAGPAGLAAANLLAELAPGQVTMIDGQPNLGGQIWRNTSTPLSLSVLNHIREKQIHLIPNSWIIHASPDGWIILDSRREKVSFNKLILATGARELFLPYPGWTSLGVMGVGGIQAAAKTGLNVKGKKILLTGSGPLLLAVADSLQSKGAIIQGVFEQAPWNRVQKFGIRTAFQYGKAFQALQLMAKVGKHVHYGHWVTRLEANQATITDGKATQQIEFDLAGIAFGLIPSLELPTLLGCQIENGFVRTDDKMQTSQPNILAAGELTSIGGVDAALAEGELAAWAALELDPPNPLIQKAKKWRRYAEQMAEAYALRPELKQLAEPDTILCRCEQVQYGSLVNRVSFRDAKINHRIGMGWCQGRICGATCQHLFDWEAPSIRPPLFPAPARRYAEILEND